MIGTSDDYNHLGTHIYGDVANVEFETICRTVCLGIGRETVLSLGNTDRELFSTQFLISSIIALAESLNVTLPAP